VSAVQPDLPRAAHRDSERPPEERLAILADRTRKASAQGAQLVVWPEMGLGFDPQTRYTEELLSLAAQTNTYLVIGYVVDDESGFRNEATVLSPSGEFLGVYGETHPMVASG
jgi:apolipoprotein N-acyltransferase